MTNYMCSLWEIVLKKPKYPGRVYKEQVLNDLLIDKLAAIHHLDRCERCLTPLVELEPRAEIIPNESMTDKDFNLALKELWDMARNQ